MTFSAIEPTLGAEAPQSLLNNQDGGQSFSN
jgi:hypothetical protein